MMIQLKVPHFLAEFVHIIPHGGILAALTISALV